MYLCIIYRKCPRDRSSPCRDAPAPSTVNVSEILQCKRLDCSERIDLFTDPQTPLRSWTPGAGRASGEVPIMFFAPLAYLRLSESPMWLWVSGSPKRAKEARAAGGDF